MVSRLIQTIWSLIESLLPDRPTLSRLTPREGIFFARHRRAKQPPPQTHDIALNLGSA